jgi:Flp pilus assembly protein TadG
MEEMARYTPATVGESEQWTFNVSTADKNRQNFCKALNGKNLFSALYGTYTVALQEFKAVLKASTPAGQSKTPKSAATQVDGFKDARRRKWLSINETAPTSNKAACTAVDTPPMEVTTRNSSPRSKPLIWTRILPTPRPHHVRQQYLPKQVDHPP